MTLNNLTVNMNNDNVDNGNKTHNDCSNITVCHELKNIKYKTMLLNGINSDLITPNVEEKNNCNIDNILQNERDINLKEPWNKLDKTIKIIKLCEYVDTIINKKTFI